jgi:hypothetical protein
MANRGNVRQCEKLYATDVIDEATRHVIPVPEMTLDGERPHGLVQVVKAGTVYFLITLGAGFVLEVIRLQILALHVSERIAHAMEIPFHLLAMIIAARWAIDRFMLPPFPGIRLGVGLVALGLWLVMEGIVIFAFHGLSIDEFLATQDPVVGTLPIGALGVLTVMPFLVWYRWER